MKSKAIFKVREDKEVKYEIKVKSKSAPNKPNKMEVYHNDNDKIQIYCRCSNGNRQQGFCYHKEHLLKGNPSILYDLSELGIFEKIQKLINQPQHRNAFVTALDEVDLLEAMINNKHISKLKKDRANNQLKHQKLILAGLFRNGF